MELRRRVRIRNTSGLHARPCHAVASAALESRSELRVTCGPLEVDGRSILELMTLKACCDSTLDLVARGPDAEELMVRLVELIESGFEEVY